MTKENDDSKEVDQGLSELNELLTNKIKSLSAAVDKIKVEGSIIRKIPDLIEEKLIIIAPTISEAILKTINQKMLQEFDKSIEHCHNKLTQLGNEIDSRRVDIKNESATNFLKKALSFGATVILSSLISLGAIHAMRQIYPTFVRINAAGNVTIERSDVILDDVGSKVVKKKK